MLTNHAIKDAVNMWFNDRDECIRKYGHISKWNTQQVTSMKNLFYNISSMKFEEDLNNWDTSNVRDMSGMFKHMTYANPKIDKWDISKTGLNNNVFFGVKHINYSSMWKFIKHGYQTSLITSYNICKQQIDDQNRVFCKNIQYIISSHMLAYYALLDTVRFIKILIMSMFTPNYIYDNRRNMLSTKVVCTGVIVFSEISIYRAIYRFIVKNI